MNQTTLSRKSIFAAACFCFATSLAAQTTARNESTSLKETSTAQEPQIVASLTHAASIPAMPLTNPNAAESVPTPVLPARVQTQPVKLLASSLTLPALSSATTAVRWTAVAPVTDRSSGHNSWISVEPGTLPPAPLYQESPSSNPYGPAPAFVNLRFGRK